MPKLFEAMSRMFKGEPVFQPEGSDEQDSAQAARPLAATAPDRSNRTDGKIAPLVIIGRIVCDIEDSYMTISGEIRNHHGERVFVDKVIILDERRELHRDMSPSEEHEFVLYRGSRPNNTHQTRVELHYRNISGDYFASIHFLEFRKLQDGMFVVDDIRFIPPVKDI